MYNASDFAAYFGKLVSNGIFYATAANLQVTVASGNEVAVLPGSAWINGYAYENTDTLELELATANGVNPGLTVWSCAGAQLVVKFAWRS